MPLLLKQKQDIKIFVLYLLRNMEHPLDFTTLHDIVVQDEFVHPFDFMDCFYELCEAGAIRKLEEDGKALYAITDEGSAAAEMLQSDLLRPIRERALRSAKRLLEGAKNKSTVTDLPDGKAKLDLECRDAAGVYMSASVVVESRRQAELMKYNFDDRAEFIHRGILSLLSGDVNYLADSWSELESDNPSL